MSQDSCSAEVEVFPHWVASDPEFADPVSASSVFIDLSGGLEVFDPKFLLFPPFEVLPLTFPLLPLKLLK